MLLIYPADIVCLSRLQKSLKFAIFSNTTGMGLRFASSLSVLGMLQGGGVLHLENFLFLYQRVNLWNLEYVYLMYLFRKEYFS